MSVTVGSLSVCAENASEEFSAVLSAFGQVGRDGAAKIVSAYQLTFRFQRRIQAPRQPDFASISRLLLCDRLGKLIPVAEQDDLALCSGQCRVNQASVDYTGGPWQADHHPPPL